jgi:hypothetical protein
MGGSKFKGLFDAARARTEEPVEEAEPVAERPAAVRPVGRPRGKRSNPDYEQISAYLRKDTYRAAKIKLLETGDDRDVSEVLEELLAAWVQQ